VFYSKATELNVLTASVFQDDDNGDDHAPKTGFDESNGYRYYWIRNTHVEGYEYSWIAFDITDGGAYPSSPQS
jgi:hypothetical protein